jgi:hypothetical protein
MLGHTICCKEIKKKGSNLSSVFAGRNKKRDVAASKANAAGCYSWMLDVERRRMAHIYPTAAAAVLVYLRRFFQPSGQQRTGLCKYNKLDPANGHPTWKKSKNRNKIRATFKDIQDGAQRYIFEIGSRKLLSGIST